MLGRHGLREVTAAARSEHPPSSPGSQPFRTTACLCGRGCQNRVADGHHAATLFRAEPDGDHDTDRYYRGDQRQRIAVAVARRLGELGLERPVIRSEEVADLVDEPG